MTAVQIVSSSSTRASSAEPEVICRLAAWLCEKSSSDVATRATTGSKLVAPPAHTSFGASEGCPSSTPRFVTGLESVRTSRTSPLSSIAAGRPLSRSIPPSPKCDPASKSTNVSEDISSGTGWFASRMVFARLTSGYSPFASPMVKVNSRPPGTTSRTRTTSPPLEAESSSPISFISISSAEAASGGVLRIIHPNPSVVGPKHTSTIVEQVVLNGVMASCGPTRVTAGPPPA